MPAEQKDGCDSYTSHYMESKPCVASSFLDSQEKKCMNEESEAHHGEIMHSWLCIGPPAVGTADDAKNSRNGIQFA